MNINKYPENLKIVNGYFLDNDTVIVFSDELIDEYGEKFHIEAEYWIDDDKYVFNDIYEDDSIPSNVSNELKNKLKTELDRIYNENN